MPSALRSSVTRDLSADQACKAEHCDDLILIRVLHQGLSPQDRTCDLGERRTAGHRWEPLGSDGLWTKGGPAGTRSGPGRLGSVGARGRG
jgi:hypothetical protein